MTTSYFCGFRWRISFFFFFFFILKMYFSSCYVIFVRGVRARVREIANDIRKHVELIFFFPRENPVCNDLFPTFFLVCNFITTIYAWFRLCIVFLVFLLLFFLSPVKFDNERGRNGK